MTTKESLSGFCYFGTLSGINCQKDRMQKPEELPMFDYRPSGTKTMEEPTTLNREP